MNRISLFPSARSVLFTLGFLLVFSLWNGKDAVALAQSLPHRHWDLTDKFKTFIHESWDFQQGLPQNNVMSIAQTPDGFLWLGTQIGLVRFDGISFKVLDRHNTPEMKSDWIRRLWVGHDSTLWAGADGGCVLSFRSGSFISRVHLDSTSSYESTGVLEDRNRTMWAATPNQAWKRINGNWTKLNNLPAGNWVASLFEDNDGSMWLGMHGALIHVIADSCIRYEASHGVPDLPISAMLRSPSGELLLGTEGKGLFIFKNGNIVPLPRANELRRLIITSLCRTTNGDLWIGTDENGVYHDDGRVIAPSMSRTNTYPLHVLAIMQDLEGSIWIATDGDGVHRLRQGMVQILNVQEAGASSDVWSVLAHGSELYIGIRGGGVRKVFQGKMEQQMLPTKHANITATSLATDADGTLWAGGEGLFRIKGRQTTEILTPSRKKFENVLVLFRDQNKVLWIGGSGLYTMIGDRVLQVRASLGLPSNVTVSALLQDNQGQLWIGTDAHGVAVIKNGQALFFTPESGLRCNSILCLFQDREGELWAGTQGAGLFRHKNGSWQACTKEHGLLDNYINSIIRDTEGTVWMATNKGFFGVHEQMLIDVTEGKVHSLSGIAIEPKDGLPTVEFGGGSPNCAAQAADGTLWFTSTRGLVGFDPRSKLRQRLLPPVYIENFVVNDRRLAAHEGAELGPNVRTIEFEYIGLAYLVPTATQYRYRLDGYDQEWRDGGSERRAIYTNLPPGSYTFRVLAANSSGVWNELGASVRISLLPNFWQTIWFKLLCVAFGSLFIFGLYRVCVWQLLRQEKKLKAGIAEAMAQVRTLRGFLPICAKCKKIRDDKGYWTQIEQYIHDHSEAEFSHGICPDCVEKLYGPYLKKNGNDAEQKDA
ncbi:MAG: two-component regulator propeller domain-containing protein [bacterium]